MGCPHWLKKWGARLRLVLAAEGVPYLLPGDKEPASPSR